MRGNVKRVGLQWIATLVMAMIFLFNYQASAFSATTGNSSGSQCSASMKECLIVEDANLIFFADPDTSLAAPSLKLTGLAGKRGLPVIDCGRPGQPYNPCVPDPNKPKKVLVFCNCMNPSGAMSMEINSSTSIIADDDESEFLMDSHSSRILQSGGTVTQNTFVAGKPITDCGKNPTYTSCLPKPNSPRPKPETCYIYKRAGC